MTARLALVEPAATRAAAYRRISRDRENDELAIKRQEQDLVELAAQLGVRIVAWFTDNDITGSGEKERSGYLDMVDGLQKRDFEMVLATEVARYQRGHREYMQFYEVCERRRAKVAWKGGMADFANTETLLQLEMWALLAREELRTIKRRVRRKHRELEEKGMPNGGGRAFGYEEDRRTIREPEAVVIRNMAKRVLQGEALHFLARELIENEIPTVHGGRWTARQIWTILTSARISGRREVFPRDEDGYRPKLGTILRDATWDGIITVEESDALRKMLTDPHRRTTVGVSYSRRPLTGLLYCECGGRMSSKGRSGIVGCPRCGNSVLTTHFIDRIHVAVRDAVERGELERLLQSERPDTSGLYAELTQIEAKQAELAELWASDDLDATAWAGARRKLSERQKAIQEHLDKALQAVGLVALPRPYRTSWDRLSDIQRRLVVSFFIEMIVIRKGGQRGKFNKERVDVRWKR